MPTLGYLLDATGSGLIPIRGTAAMPSLGDSIPKPNGVGQLFLPPRQHYALAELPASRGIAVWHLARRHMAGGTDVLDSVPGFAGTPDVAVFSPTGKSAAIYSAADQRVQVVTGLPGTPSIQSKIPELSGAPASIFLSDDGRLVLTTNTNGQISLSVDGEPFHDLAWTYAPMTLSFISNTHNLLLSDAWQKQLLLIQNVEAPNAPPVALARDLAPDRLAICNDGESIAALDSFNQKLWIVDAQSNTVTSTRVTRQAEELVLLRDGHTLLLSDSPLSVMKLADSGVNVH